MYNYYGLGTVHITVLIRTIIELLYKTFKNEGKDVHKNKHLLR